MQIDCRDLDIVYSILADQLSQAKADASKAQAAGYDHLAAFHGGIQLQSRRTIRLIEAARRERRERQAR